jgi:hypothetical protein
MMENTNPNNLSPLLRSALVVTALVSAAPAAASVPQTERDILEAFYQAANGDQWHRNDGWLEAGSDPCDWYGVECEYRWGPDRDVVSAVELPGNNLSGSLDTRIFEIVHERLDLGNNALSGPLDVLPASPSRVNLSGNALGGELPAQVSEKAGDFTGSGYQSGNWYLDLSDNGFSGEVPESWNGPYWLDLSNNALEGLPTNLLTQSGHPLGGKYLNLADNRFSGEVPAEAMEAMYVARNHTRWGGGLNLCWNDFEVDDPMVADWLAQVHVGGDYEQCLNSERQPLDPTVSGSWYHPLRSGEGVVAHLLDSGQPMLYWFTHDDEGRQLWLFQVGRPKSNAMTWPELLETRGRFGSGLAEATPEQPALEARASLRLDRVGDDRMIAERVMIEEGSGACLAVYPPPLNCFGDSYSDRLEYQRLSQLAGADCESGSDYRQYSGAWYNPERSGEGFLIEVLSDTRALVYWFTYEPDDSGQQAWMVGEGRIDASGADRRATISVSRVIQPVGGGHGADYEPQLIQQVDWGSLEIVFDDSNTAQLSYDSNLEQFGSGEYALRRLARPLLPDCSN